MRLNAVVIHNPLTYKPFLFFFYLHPYTFRSVPGRYFSFHYRRYFRTPPLSCPITLSGTPPISSAMSTGRDDQALITSPCIFYPSVQRKPPLYFAQQNTGGRGVTWPNNRQSVYNSSLNTIKKLLRTSHLHDSYRIHFLLSQKK